MQKDKSPKTKYSRLLEMGISVKTFKSRVVWEFRDRKMKWLIIG